MKCRECSATYPLDARYVCERCFGPLEVAYASLDGVDVDGLRRRIQAGPQSIWRYADFLPLETPPAQRSSARLGLPAGCTPLVRADRLAERLGIDAEVWVKNDAANPTHSFKDRVVSVASARAAELGFETLACASTGNLANAVAAQAAALGLESYVFIPADLEEQKILAHRRLRHQPRQGPRQLRRRQPALHRAVGRAGRWAFVNVNMRPYYAEGSKTIAYEIAEQLGWQTPDRLVAPIASGSLFTKIAQGLRRMARLRPDQRRACRR